ncbi:MAG TPA: SDR family NAD(P)-dependent oxidoreductase, partial [Chloroflexota bacterium]|nr:SDR family NAD(P)-dependent oxidoreductase [Chloroflexota bacterium]
MVSEQASGTLSGKVACITGAGTGIGVGIALAMADAGADVAVSYFGSEEGARKTAEQIEAKGRRALLRQADVAIGNQARALVDETVETLGRIDIMVNNSGVTWPKPFLELDEETWDRTFGINLRGMYLCSQRAAQHMVKQGNGGRIINLSSVHGFSATRNHAHYEATKGGINMFTKALAIELAEHQITVNAIAPGAIEVERYYRTMPNYDRNTTGKKIPLGRVGVPEDVAPLAVFLASEDASY